MKREMDKTLSALLWRLSKQVTEKVKEYRTKGELIQTRTLYVKPKVENFVFKEGSSSYTTSFTYVQKKEWHWKDQHDFIQKVIKQFPTYSDCVAEISKRSKVPNKHAEFWLSSFVQILVNKAVDPLTDEFVVDQVTTFISDLNNSPIDWEIKIWLDGIWLEEEQYKLGSEIILRRPNPSDLEVERPFNILPDYHHFRYPHIGSSFLEFVFRCKSDREVQIETELILDVLRLFRLGSVTKLAYEIFPKSFLHMHTTYNAGQQYATPYKYAFRSADVDALESLMKKIKPILRQDPVLTEPVTGVSSISIAFQRYKDALLQHVAIESRITSAITCLEALYLKAEERAELVHRLGQRASALLRLVGFVPLEVYNNISQAYDIRSTYIHGSQIDKERQQSANKLCKIILEYARVSLLVFFQLKETVEKENVINKLDNSLLDKKAEQKTKDLICEDIIITK